MQLQTGTYPPLFVNKPNFRDLAERVRSIPLRQRTIFRSNHLGKMSAQDALQIREMGVARVVDLRGAQERLPACEVPGVVVHHFPIEHSVLPGLREAMQVSPLTAPVVQDHMQRSYRSLVRDGAAQFKNFFTLLAEDARPLVFHCTAGKDRTGIVAALLLRILGATEDDVLQDYLATNERLRPPPGAVPWLNEEEAAIVYDANLTYLDAAYREMESLHGGIDGYVEKALLVDSKRRDKLRSMYLAKA